jgi:uncharacterized protein YbjT (DUF2867 family)
MNGNNTRESYTQIVLVTGGTGTIGRLVVPKLRDAGRRVRALSRSRREVADGVEYVAADLSTGEGVEDAVRGVGVVVNLAGSAKGDDEKAATLARAAARAGVRHLVHISVVGVDRIPVVSGVDRTMFGYFAAKLAAERNVAESGVPWTTLRSTQVHDLLFKVVQAITKMPVAVLPAGFRFQPVDASEVADRLVELALGEPAGLVPDIAGPKIYTAAELFRSYLRAAGKYRPVVPVWLPGRAARAFRDGANLSPERAVGRRTWEEFLAERVGSSEEFQVDPVSS